MAERVKPKRSYHSPRRQAQAAATRRSILEAAQRLFERQGYATTTMDAIAEDAGVALKTVYVAFATKSGVLRGLWDLLLKGDLDEAAVAERPWYREVLDEVDPHRQLRMNARNSRVVKERIAGVLETIRNAASHRRRHRRPLEPDPDRLLRQPAHHRAGPAPEEGAPAWTRRHQGNRHPLDVEPPRHVATAGRQARVDTRAVREVVRRHRLLAAPEASSDQEVIADPDRPGIAVITSGEPRRVATFCGCDVYARPCRGVRLGGHDRVGGPA